MSREHLAVPTSHRLIFIPGLGADGRLFGPQLEAFPGAEVLAWIPAREGESLSAYSARLAETIPAGDAPMLIGASMGGMIALEMADLVGARGVVLIASCRSRRAVNRAAYPMEFFSRAIPDRVIERSWRTGPGLRVLFGPMTAEQRAVMQAMARDASLPFVRWAGRAILRWRGRPQIKAPVRHIHGRRDRIIMPQRVSPDAWVDGGHLLTLKRPREVNEFIADALVRFQSEARAGER